MSKITTLGDVRKTTKFAVSMRPRVPKTPTTSVFGPYLGLDKIPSRAPVGLRSADRDDPYFSQLWDGPSQAWWNSYSRYVTDRRNGNVARNARLDAMLTPAPVETVWTDPMCRLMASLLMWRTATADQVAALTGDTTWRGHTAGSFPAQAARLWSVGMIGTGRLNRPHGSGAAIPTLVRPAGMSQFDKVSLPLSYNRWLSITAGVSVNAPVNYSRHNVLATEAALRIAEFGDVQAVVGESVSSLHALTGHAASGNRRGDFTIIRSDGLRVVVEMSTTVALMKEKIAAWGQALASDPTRSVAVVFLCAGSPTEHYNIDTNVRMTLSRYLIEDPVARVSRLGQRMFVVGWQDWFGQHSAIRDLDKLPVFAVRKDIDKPSGVLTSWRRLNVGDPESTPWADADSERANVAVAVAGCHHMLGMAHFLRDKKTAAAVDNRIEASMVRSAGFTSMPVLPFDRSTFDGRDAPSPQVSAAAFTPGPIALPTIAERVIAAT